MGSSDQSRHTPPSSTPQRTPPGRRGTTALAALMLRDVDWVGAAGQLAGWVLVAELVRCCARVPAVAGLFVSEWAVSS